MDSIHNLFNYLDYEKKVDCYFVGHVKIEKSELLYADEVKNLMSRLVQEDFKAVKQNVSNNICFVNFQRYQTILVEFVGVSKHLNELKMGLNPLFRVTLNNFENDGGVK